MKSSGTVLDQVAAQASWQQSRQAGLGAAGTTAWAVHNYSTAEMAAVHGLASAIDEYKRAYGQARQEGRCTLEAMLLADVSSAIEEQWQQELGEGTVEGLHRKLIDLAATAVQWAQALDSAAKQGPQR